MSLHRYPEKEKPLNPSRESHPDLIILEGTVTGTKVLAEAKQLDSGMGIIMLMGGTPSVDQLVELMNQGVNDVLVSPLDITDVQTKSGSGFRPARG